MRYLTALLLLALPGLALAAPPPDFDARIEVVMDELGVPGAAVAIVENGEVTLARGYGLRALETRSAVDADTLFQIGSASKAFTAAALATLVDENRIRWDDPVIDHLPGFRMYDPWVTREITVRDLLVHRSGLGRGQGDLLYVPATRLSRAETVKRLRHLKPATSFRASAAYDNILYIAAGELIEAVTGKTWEVYVRERLLVPAGMSRSVTSDADRFLAGNRALPHGRNGQIRGIGPQQLFDEKAVALGANSAPAGAIASSANDLARWIAIQLAGGQITGADRRIYSAASGLEMWQPVVPIPATPLPGALADAAPRFRNFALGWVVQDYRGHRIVQHAGGTQGFRAVVVLIPEKKTGFAIVNNSEDNAFVPGLLYELLDHYLGLPQRDWSKAFADYFEERNAKGLAAVQASVTSRPVTKPSLPLPAYAGNYADPWYGEISIRESGGALSIDFLQTPGMTGPLEHWAYDTFLARWPDPMIEPAFVSFALDVQGKPDRITMKAVSPVADFSFDYQDLSFTPVAPEKVR